MLMAFPILMEKVRIVFVSLKEQIIEYKVCFEFPTTNNISEYEALLAGLLLTDALNAYPLQAYSDS